LLNLIKNALTLLLTNNLPQQVAEEVDVEAKRIVRFWFGQVRLVLSTA
jgi:hypothetical protein